MAPSTRQILLILKRIVIVIGIAAAFSLGLFGAIYLSLRSSETRVPDVIGKDERSAEETISDAGLNFRVRARRITADAKPDTVLIQLPRAGEIVKVGQTVAVDISRATSNGETPPPVSQNTNSAETTTESQNTNSTAAPTPTPRKKPANANANATNSNQDRNANANRPTTNLNGNVNRVATPAPGRPNVDSGNDNRSNNRRPVPAPTP